MASKLPRDEFGEDLLTCSICYEHFRTPKVLPCLHSFCQDCISRHYGIYKTKHRGKLFCPTCREVIPLPENGIQGFKNDAVVLKVKEILKKLPAIVDNLNSTAYNDQMNTETEADSGRGSLIALGTSLASTVGSMVLGNSGSDGDSGDGDDISDDETPSRPREYTKPQRNLQELGACGGTSDDTTPFMSRRQKIRMFEPADIAKKRFSMRKSQEDFQSSLARLRMKMLLLYRIENHVKGSIESEVSQQFNQIEQSRRTSRYRKKLYGVIAEKHGPTLALLVTEQDKLYRSMVEIKAIHDIIEEVLEKASSHQLDGMHWYLMNWVKKEESLVSAVLETDKENLLKGLQLPEDLINIVKTEMETCKNATLTVAAPLRNPRQMGINFLFKISGFGSTKGRFDFPTHATFMPSGDILVADKNNQRLQIFNSFGQFQQELMTGIIKPRRARVNPRDGMIYVSDEKCETVKVFTAQGELVRRIGEGYFQCPAGLDFDSHGNLIMTDPEKGYVTVHDAATGETTFRFMFRYLDDKKMPNPYYLAVNEDDQFIISDTRNDKVKIFSNTGQLLVKIPKVDCPRGVCTDPFGNILIAEGDKHRVSMYNPYGKFVQNLIETEEFGLRYPLSLDMDKDGRLLVTQCGYAAPHEVLVFQMG